MMAMQAAEKTKGRIERVFHDDKGSTIEVYISMPRWTDTAIEFDELWRLSYGVTLYQVNEKGWNVMVFGPGGVQYCGQP